MLEIRTAGAADIDVLTMAWHEAALWRPEDLSDRPDIAECLEIPDLARYRWNPDDAAEVAVIATIDGIGVGGAWTKSFTSAEPGYGFVDAATPELGIGVARDRHGRGIGRALLATLLAAAGAAGHDRLSLSVEWDNPSRRLYQQLGFTDVGINGNAFTMIRAMRHVA